MLMLISIILSAILIASIILPWLHNATIRDLKRDIERLNLQMSLLIQILKEKGTQLPKEFDKPKNLFPYSTKSEWVEPMQRKTEVQKQAMYVSKPKVETEPSLIQKIFSKTSKANYEQKFAQSLPVWIGGIALALAGVFLVKYSIETGLLSPTVRLSIGCLFGIVLLFGGSWIQAQGNIANGKRISQALSGAGIAVLYVCLLAATSLYHLIPNLFGFIGMAVVTAIAVVLSLKQGPPIAFLGMVGGFLTPALIGSHEPNAPLLFVYLYFVFIGLMTVIRKNNWWFLSIPVVLCAFIWVIVWLNFYFIPSDGLWLGLFIIAISVTIVAASKKAMEDGVFDESHSQKISGPLNYLALGGAVLLMSAVAAKSQFGEMEWAFFAFLSAGGIVLSYYNQTLYGFVPWVSMVMNVILLWTWPQADPTVLATTIFGFGLLFSMSSYLLMWRSQKPLSWALMAGSSSLVYYLLAYGKFHNWDSLGFFISHETHLWGLLAFGLFFLSTISVVQLLNRFDGEKDIKQKILTIFTLTSTAFLSIGLTIELDHEFLTIAIASEILVLSWINNHVEIKILRALTGILAIVFGILLVPKIIMQIMILSLNFENVPWHLLTFYWPSGFIYLQDQVSSMEWSLFHLGLPGLLFIVSSLQLRRQKDDAFVSSFELTALSLFAVMTYYLLRHAFHLHENLLFTNSTFLEMGTLTNLYFLMAYSCFWIGRTFKRKAVSYGGMILLFLSLSRILFFDILLFNPLWSHEAVGDYPILNGLLLPFGFPMIWLILMKDDVIKLGNERTIQFINASIFSLLFCFVSFNVRQFFHHPYLDQPFTSNAEIYSYSVAWLLTGIGLLIFGTLTKDKTIRIASLVFMMFTIGKVFLYDASELTGLFRVFSFLGLGLSLIALSWFYSRFVFNQSK